MFGRRGWLIAHHQTFGRMMEGNKIILFENGRFLDEQLKKALVCREDVMQGVRKSAKTENMADIDKVYMERSGEISVIKK